MSPGEQPEVPATTDWIHPPRPFSGRIELVPYDPAWPSVYDAVARRIRDAIGSVAVVLEHGGSTSVPGLSAKPIIDVILGVPDATDEAAYVAALEGAGFQLAIREPDWHEHRLFRDDDPLVNLHTFSAGSTEIRRMLAFRDWLRTNAADRARYEAAKQDLATRTWATVQDYADAKTDVVEAILERALAADDATDVHGPEAGSTRP